jgi:hypothetical protein
VAHVQLAGRVGQHRARVELAFRETRIVLGTRRWRASGPSRRLPLAQVLGVQQLDPQHLVLAEAHVAHAVVVAQIRQAVDPRIHRIAVGVGKAEGLLRFGVERRPVRDAAAVEACGGHGGSFRASSVR